MTFSPGPEYVTIGKPLHKDCVTEAMDFSLIVKEVQERRTRNGPVADNYQIQLEEFVASHLVGDKVFSYKTPKSSWRSGMGHMGYVLIRNGVVATFIMTKFN